MKKRILSIILAISMLFTLCVPTSFAASYEITNTNYTSFGVCIISWSDVDAPYGYQVKAYEQGSTTAVYSDVLTDTYVFMRLFAEDGKYYYITVSAYNVSGAPTATSDAYQYNASSDTSYPNIIYSASYDTTTETLSWKSYGTGFYGYRIDTYITGDENTIYKQTYTQSTSISASEIYPDSGTYWFKIWLVDSNGGNISSSASWICVRTGSYEYTFPAHTHSYTSEVTTAATCTKDGVMTYTCSCGDTYTEVIPATGHDYVSVVTAPTCTEGGYTTFTCSECGQYYTAYNTEPTGHTTEIQNAVEATCTTDGYTGDEVCTVCGETVTSGEVIPATGHNYENGVCTVCGAIEPATGDVSNGSASVTVSDSENSSIKPDVINENYVSVGTVTINTDETYGTLEIKTVTDSTSGELTYNEPSTGNSVSLSTSSDITVKSVISGKVTNSSGTEFTAKGTVLFYGDLSFTDEGSPLDVSSSTFTIDLTPNGSSIDPNSLVVLHYTGSAWEQLDSSATVDTNGKITVSFTTTTLSPIMVLTTSASYGYVSVGEVYLYDGYYTTDGATSSNENLPTSGYAYYSGGVLYLNAFEYEYTGTASEFSLIGGGSYELTVDLCDTTSTLSGGAYGIYCKYNFIVQNGELVLDLKLGDNWYTVGLYNYNYNYRRDITLNDCKLTVTAPYGSAISSVGDVNINSSTIIAECWDGEDNCYAIEAGGNFGGSINITDSTIEATVTIDSTLSVDDSGNAGCIDSTEAVNITNSTITATVNAGNGAVDGVIESSNDLTITNSTITVTASGNSVWSTVASNHGSVIIEEGSTITSTGEGKYAEDAIWAEAAITISESNVTSTITNLDTGKYPAGTDDEDKVPEWWEYDVYAIRAYDDITIIDSNVEATVVLKNYASSPDFTINGIAIAATDSSFILSPSTGETMSVKLSKTGTPTTYSSQTTIADSAWSSYDYVLISTSAVVTHTHTYGNPVWYWATDYTTATATFTCVDNDDTKVVDATIDTIITDPTCTTGGSTVKTATVTFNGSTYTNEVTTATTSATGHTTEVQNAVDATCTTDGYTGDKVCTVCSKTIETGEVIPATGHTNSTAVTENEMAATCTTDGSYDLVVYCSVCGDEISRETMTVAATGHTYEAVVTAPTCTQKGYTTYTCSECGDSYTADETDALGHTWDEGVVITEATCIEDGVMTYTCTVCGETKTEAIPATGHTEDEPVVENNVAPTCTEDGSYDSVVYCSVCGDEISRETITVQATGHSYSATFTWGENYVTATVELKCDNCNEVVTDNLTVNVTNLSGIYVASVTYDNVTYYSAPVETITVTWVDEDTTELRTAVVAKDETISHGTTTPTKDSDDQYEYTFAGWTEETDSYGNITYTATYTAIPHTYTATFTWASDLNSATVTLTCSDCGHTVDSSSSLSVLVTSVNRLGVVTRTATVTFNGVTYTDQKVTGKSLLTVQANYAAVNEAIARANALNASDYVDFSAVTAAINAVQWNLNVLNQNAVNAYAEAINTAIDNLVEVSATVTEETVVIDEPIEETDTEAEPDETETLEVSDPEPEADSNPTTGIALTVMPLALALAAVVLGKKK